MWKKESDGHSNGNPVTKFLQMMPHTCHVPSGDWWTTSLLLSLRSKPAFCLIKLALDAASGCPGSAVHVSPESNVFTGWMRGLWVEVTCLTLSQQAAAVNTQTHESLQQVYFSLFAMSTCSSKHILKGYATFFSFCYLPSSRVPDKNIDTIILTVSTVTRRRTELNPSLTSLAQILVVNGKC